MRNTILVALAILLALVVVKVFYSPRESTREEGVCAAFAGFRNAKFDQASRITIAKSKAPPVELKKAGGKWVVASAFAYPADGEKVEKILKSLGEIKTGERRGTGVPEEYELDEKKGAVITAYADDGKALGKLVVGKNVSGGGFSTPRVFVHFGDDPTTYAVESGIRSDASLYSKEIEAKSYLLKKVVSIPEEMEVQSVRLTRPEKPDLLVERKYKDVPVVKPNDAADEKKEENKEAEKKEGETAAGEKKDEKKEEKKPETKKEEYFVVTSASETKDVGKSEEYTARSLLNRGKDFSIEDAAEPKDLKEYGLDKPQLKAELSYRKKDQADAELKTLTFLFGNAKKDEKGENKGYYVVIDNEEQKGRIYLVQSWTFTEWNKEMKDFLPKPKEEEKPKEAPKEAPKSEGAPAPTTAPGPTPSQSGSAAAPPATPAPPAPQAGATPATPASPAPSPTPPSPAPKQPASTGAPPSPPPAPSAAATPTTPAGTPTTPAGTPTTPAGTPTAPAGTPTAPAGTPTTPTPAPAVPPAPAPGESKAAPQPAPPPQGQPAPPAPKPASGEAPKEPAK